MKKFLALLAIVIVSGIIFWQMQAPAPEPVDQVRIINPIGPTVIPIAGLDSGEVSGDVPVKVHYWRTIDEAAALLAADQAEFAALPVTAAANLHARGINIVLLGVYQWKAFYLIAGDNLVFEDWHSLQDKTVYSAVGRGTTSDIIMRAALLDRGMVPDQDVTFLYAPPQEIVSLYQGGKVEFAALPEPFVTLSIGGNLDRIVLDFQDYWGQTYNTEPRIPITGFFVKRDFWAEHPEQVRETVRLFAASNAYALEEPDRALETAHNILPIPVPVLKNALARMDFYFVPALECRDEVEFYLQTLFDLYPESIAAVPDDSFYSP